MLESITIGISIDRDWRDLYEAIWRPAAFPSWASGLSNASLVRQGEIWTAQGPEGPIQIRFTDRNEFGVMDHWVDLGGGRVVYVPLRIVANGSGAEVLLTLFRQPEMSDAKFAQDQDWGETRPAGAESAGGTLAELRVSISERA
jgi:hypothetical protein